MRILLINSSPVVGKLVTLSAQKTGDELQVIDNIKSVPAEQFDLLLLDKEFYSEDAFAVITKKAQFDKYILIADRGSEKPKDFTLVLEKPFLPTDLVEILLNINMPDEGFESEESSDDLSESDLEMIDQLNEAGTVKESLNIEDDLDLDSLDDFNALESDFDLEAGGDLSLNELDENLDGLDEDLNLGGLDDDLDLDGINDMLDDTDTSTQQQSILDENDISEVKGLLEDEDLDLSEDSLDLSSDFDSELLNNIDDELLENETGLDALNLDSLEPDALEDTDLSDSDLTEDDSFDGESLNDLDLDELDATDNDSMDLSGLDEELSLEDTSSSELELGDDLGGLTEDLELEDDLGGLSEELDLEDDLLGEDTALEGLLDEEASEDLDISDDLGSLLDETETMDEAMAGLDDLDLGEEGEAEEEDLDALLDAVEEINEDLDDELDDGLSDSDEFGLIDEDEEGGDEPDLIVSGGEFASLTEEALSEALGERASDDSLLDEDMDAFEASELEEVGKEEVKETPSSAAVSIDDSIESVKFLLESLDNEKLRKALKGMKVSINISFDDN